MDYQHYQGSLASSKQLNKLLSIFCVCLSVSLIVMGFCVYRAIGYKSTVFVPPVLTQQMTISDVYPDRSYLNQMALYLALLRLNVTPSNIENNFNEFLKRVDSSIFNEMKHHLDQQIKEVQESRISAAFYPRSQKVNVDEKSVFITGMLTKFVGTRLVSSKEASFIFVFSYRNGSLTIKDYYPVKEKR